jgi:hypothetical protein
MSLSSRNRTILCKIESSYGVDPTPTGSANAILCKNLNVTPMQADKVSRDLLRPYYGNSEQLIATRFMQLEFEVEAAGAGFAGKVPAYDPLLRACALAKTIQTTSITISVSSGVATVTKASHGYSGTGNKVVIAGANESDLNGDKSITVIDTDSFSYTTTEADGAATGTIVLQTSVDYAPISTGFESSTIYYQVDGVKHKATGCRGSVELVIAVGQIPIFRFSFTGIYNDPIDASAPTVDYDGFMTPKIANTQNTPGFSLFSYSGNLESANFNLANQVQYVALIGEESVKILDRKPAGAFVIEAPLIADKDFFTLASDGTNGDMTLTHGNKAGEKVIVLAPKVNLENPAYQDSNGIMMLNIPYTANPDTGNDELTIRVA